MKLASFHADGRTRVGVATGDGRLAELGDAVGGAAWAGSVLDLIEAGPDAWALARQAAIDVERDPTRFRLHDTATVTWLAPVLRPSKIVCVALNNSANSDRIMSGPKHPATFIKPSSALVGHLGTIECRPDYGRTHPEPELAAVIGRRVKNITADQAYDHIFGYTIHNDITSPTMRQEDTFHYRAIHPKGDGFAGIEYVDTWTSYSGRYKCSDTFAPMGPFVVTTDEIPDPHALTVQCYHRDDLVTEDSTANLFVKLPEMMAFLSRYMTLLPGDILSMGTALKKSTTGGAVQNIDLNRLGGPVSVTIERIGTLTNPVVTLAD